MNLYTRKQRKKVYLYVDFSFSGKRYRRPLNLEDTPKNRKLAKTKIMPEIQYKLNSGEFFNNEKEKIPTVGEYMPISFELHSGNRRELTRKGYDSVYNLHIKPYFEDRQIDSIRPSDIIRWQNTLLKTLSAKRVRSIRSVLNTMYIDAINDEVIEKNPFSRAPAPKKGNPAEKIPFTMKEMFAIIKAVPLKMRAYFAIGFMTGLRTGELCSLRTEHINLDKKIIKVRCARRAGIESEPKTPHSIRDVVILDQLIPYLLEHIEMMSDKSDYLFLNKYGKPYYSSSKISYTYWKPTLKKLNLPYRKMYLMRHSFISLMISKGEDILWVSKNVGHKDVSITFKEYARYIDDGTKQRATFLQDVA